MRHSGVDKFRIRIDALAKKASEDRGGRSSVEAAIVEEDSNFGVFWQAASYLSFGYGWKSGNPKVT